MVQRLSLYLLANRRGEGSPPAVVGDDSFCEVHSGGKVNFQRAVQSAAQPQLFVVWYPKRRTNVIIWVNQTTECFIL